MRGMTGSRQAALLLLALLQLACSESSPVFHDQGSPPRLSDWNLFALDSEALTPRDSTLVFRPANQLFTDYAQKLRTLWIPGGSQAQLRDGEIDYPVGTVLSKTFYYGADSAGGLLLEDENPARAVSLADNRLLETRLLVRRESGWQAFPYVWNEEQTEAFLRVAGTNLPLNLHAVDRDLDFVYFVPNENQCAGCHVTEHPDGDLQPLAAVSAQLNASFAHPGSSQPSQIEELIARGWLNSAPTLAPSASWRDESAILEDRALAYLNIHCGHCHNPDGAADTSALLLDGSHDSALSLGVCKTPVAAGGGAGDRLYSIVPGAPAQSILVYRMQSAEPDEMMPELGRSLIHQEGLDLISRWISQLPGEC